MIVRTVIPCAAQVPQVGSAPSHLVFLCHVVKRRIGQLGISFTHLFLHVTHARLTCRVRRPSIRWGLALTDVGAFI